LRALSTRATAVLFEYIGKADLRHPGQVFETASAELERATGYSRSSITGANRDLVAADLIKRPRPDLHGARRLGTPIWKTFLTQRALDLLFPTRAQKVEQPLDKELKSLRSQDSAPAETEASNPEQPLPAATATKDAIHIRQDLQPLLQVLQPEQITTVLATAKRCGVWLQDVLKHRLQAVLQAHTPLGLLMHLVRSGQDWTRPAELAGQQAPATAQGSVASASTLAGWREDEEWRRRDAEHQAALSREKLAVAARAAREVCGLAARIREQQRISHLDAKSAASNMISPPLS
jgi:hypothetical protein